MKSNDLVNLMFSPQWISTLLHHFISGAKKINPQGIKAEILYLVIPFVTDDVTRGVLSNANTRSNFSSVFYKKDLSEKRIPVEIKNALMGKNNQIEQYREITNRGFIYLGNTVALGIGKYITVTKITNYKYEKGINRDYCKAAYNLGVILAKEDYRNVFVKLGLTNI